MRPMKRRQEPLLCELHAHTTWSDGELSLSVGGFASRAYAYGVLLPGFVPPPPPPVTAAGSPPASPPPAGARSRVQCRELSSP